MVINSKKNKEIMVIVISVLIAFLLWLYVMGEKNPMQNKMITDVPVVLTSVEVITQSNLALIPQQSFTVDLSASGRFIDISKLLASDIKVEADMSGYLKKGNNNIPIKIKSLAKGVSITGKNGTSYINVRLDALAEKSVPVIVNVKGNVKDGYGYTPPIVRPTEIKITGPATFVESITVATGDIKIGGNYSNVSGSILLSPMDKNGTPVFNVNVVPKYADVTVSIKPLKEVPIKINTRGSIGSGKILMAIKSQLDKISIIGDKKYIDRIGEIETMPLDLSKVYTSKVVKLFLNVPNGISIIGGVNSINIDLNVENKVEKVINIPISMLNQSTDFNYIISVNKVLAKVIGASSIINTIDDTSFTATVDMNGFTDGTYILPIALSKIDGVDFKTYSPDKVTVSINKK